MPFLYDERTPERDPDEPHEIIRGKWLMDGATTLRDAAAQLESFAGVLRTMDALGYRLDGEIDDDYGFVLPPRQRWSSL